MLEEDKAFEATHDEPEEQCMDCGAIGPHFCSGVPGGFGDNELSENIATVLGVALDDAIECESQSAPCLAMGSHHATHTLSRDGDGWSLCVCAERAAMARSPNIAVTPIDQNDIPFPEVPR